MAKLSKFLFRPGICFFAVLLACSFGPSFCRAAAPATGMVTVVIRNESGNTVRGDWNLYYGVGRNHLLARRGSMSESFVAQEGYYFLEVKGPVNSRPYFFRYSKTPQYLSAGSNIFFYIQYYKTQEAMLTAANDPLVKRNLETTSAGLPTNDAYDVHGCNLTRGYAWCAQSQTCTKNWSTACQVGAAMTGASGAVSGAESMGYIPLVTTIRTAMTGRNQGVVKYGRYLFATGPSVALLIISSSLLSLGILRRSGTRRRRP